MFGVKRVVPRYDYPAKRWRKVLLDNCVERLQERRASLVAARRMKDTIHKTISEEASLLKDVAEPFIGANGTPPEVLSAQELNDLEHDILEALELHEDEQCRLIEYADRIAEEEAYEIARDMAALDLYDLSANKRDVPCPICFKASLCEEAGDIFCSCGLRLESANKDGLTLPTMSDSAGF